MTETSNNLFQAKAINGLSGDPAFFCLFPLAGKALLLDAGNIDALSNKEILRIKYVCVSHTHIDHFIGFDRLLRVHIPHQRPIYVYGPEGLAANILGKLNGYSWNLLVENQITFHVTECRADGCLRESLITNHPQFTLRQIYDWKVAHQVILEPGLELNLLTLEHGSVLSCTFMFSIFRKNSIHVDALTQLGLKPGSWIAKLQDCLKLGLNDQTIEIEGKTFGVSDLAAKVCRTHKPFRFMYVTDVAFSKENVAKLMAQETSLDLLISESCFRDHDFKRALAKKHLTTKQAALFAAITQASQLQTFHYSQIYGAQDEADQGAEAQCFFEQFRALNATDLRREIDLELLRGQTA